MSVFRINKTDNYTVMSNYHLKDKSISLKSKGLLSQMLSLPNNWDYSIAGLVAINREEETSIKSALKELRDNRYLKITKVKPSNLSNRFSYIYDIYETPYQEGGSLGVENLGLEVLGVENQGQLNKDKLNTNKLNKEEYKEEEYKELFEYDWLNGGDKDE